MNCIVVDDEPIAREGMADYVDRTPFLNLVSSCANAFEAMECLNQQQIDLVFLDINMPQLTGIEMLESLHNAPMIIFATANPNHALEGFELNAIDYLLKPISYSKFLKASQKAHEIYQLKKASQQEPEEESIFLKVNKDLVKVNFDDMLYIEGLKDYVLVHTTEKQLITYLSMTKMNEALPNYFLQVHRSFIVNTKKVSKLQGSQITIGEEEIPIGRTYKERVIAKIVGDKIIKK